MIFQSGNVYILGKHEISIGMQHGIQGPRTPDRNVT